MVVCVNLPGAIQYHTVIYDIQVFSVLQIKHIIIKVNEPITPYDLFYNKGSCLVLFRLCGFAVVTEKYNITTTIDQINKNTTRQRGVMGFFLGFLF
jgi:hypothetical protein